MAPRNCLYQLCLITLATSLLFSLYPMRPAAAQCTPDDPLCLTETPAPTVEAIPAEPTEAIPAVEATAEVTPPVVEEAAPVATEAAPETTPAVETTSTTQAMILSTPVATTAEGCGEPYPDPPNDYVYEDYRIDCEGLDTTGVTSDDSVMVTITDGSAVNNTQSPAGTPPVDLYDNSRVENYGTVEATGSHAIRVHDRNVVTNRDFDFEETEPDPYTIISHTHDGVNGGYDLFVANAGTISGGDNAINAGNDLTANNLPGGVIIATNDAIQTTNNASISNSGYITSNTADAIQTGDNASIVNGEWQPGVVTGGSSAIETGNNSWVGNGQHSTLQSRCDTVVAGDNLHLNNDASIGLPVWERPQNGDNAIIHSEDCTAIVAGDYTQIVNYGEISGGGVNGIRVDDTTLIENYGDLGHGTITGSCHGIRAGDDLYLYNSGDITGVRCDGVSADANLTANIMGGTISATDLNGDGIDMDYGTIFIHPDGTVLGGDNGIEIDGTTDGTTLIWNAGTISGNVGVNAHLDGNTDSQHVINGGTIEGTGGTAVDLGRGDDELEALAGSLFLGTIDGGADHDVFTFTYYFEAEQFYVPDEYRQIEQTIASAPTEGCPCVLELVVGGVTYSYVYVNFEQLRSLLHFIQTQVQSASTSHMSCYNGVRCYALESNGSRTGVVSVYNAEGEQGVEIASFDVWALEWGSQVFTNADGWRVEIGERQDSGDTTRYTVTVYDADGQLRVTGMTLLLFNSSHSFAWE